MYMIYKGIIFKADPFSYNLEFDDRITLVGGDSGTGKTFLYGLLKDIRLTEEYKAIKLFKSLFTFVCLIPRQYNYTFHELRKQLENQVVQIQIQS